MRYIVLLKGSPITSPPPPELMGAIMQLGEEATKAGALLDTAGLAPSAQGARVRLAGGTELIRSSSSEISFGAGRFGADTNIIGKAIHLSRSVHRLPSSA